jgi:quercetin dioxygenase-like cupin family protein
MPPGGGQEVRIPGFGAVFKLGGTDTGGEVAIVELPFAIGTITAPHRHTHEVEHSTVLEGQIGFRSDDSEVVLGPGGYITKPRGQMHAMWNVGNVPGRIWLADGIERFHLMHRIIDGSSPSGRTAPALDRLDGPGKTACAG